jgi:hypothetical protein
MSTIFTATATDEYLAAINAPGVNVVDVEWTTEVRPAAAHRGVSLTKHTEAKAMTGVEYRNLAVNNDRETGALPWGEWVDGLYPWVIEHKGQRYARIYTVDGTLRTTYFVNGEAVDRETFAEYLTPSQRTPKRPNGGTLTVKMDNLRVRR